MADVFLTSPIFWIGFALCSIWMLRDVFLLRKSEPNLYTWPQAAVGIALNIAVAALAYYTFIVVGVHHRHYVPHNVLVVASFVWAVCALRTAWWLRRPGHLGQWNLRCAAWLIVSAYAVVATLAPIVY